MIFDIKIKVPSPEHPMTVQPYRGRTVVEVAGSFIADTQLALVVGEGSYPPVHYIPRSDVNVALLVRSEHRTYCPYKGDSAYYSIPVGGSKSINAVWTYERPYEAVASVKDHSAFYVDRVDVIQLADQLIQ